MADDRNLDNENDLLREQIRLLQEANRLQRESFDISSSAVDSLKETMGINSRRSTFESSILKINKQVAQAILDQKTGLRDIESINKQIAKNQDLLNKSKRIEESIEGELSKRSKDKINSILEVYKQQQKYTQEIENGNLAHEKELASLDFILESQLKSLSYREKLLLATKQTTQELELQNQLREGEKNIEKNLESQLGLTGKIAKTLSQFRGIADDVNEALETTKKKYRDIADAGGELPGKWEAFSTLIGNTFTNLSKRLGDPLIVVTSLLNIFKDIDSSSGDFAKSMNVTYSEALKVKEEMSSIAVSSNDISLTSTRLMETLSFVGKQLGMNAQLNKEDLVTMTKLREKAGFTNEELMGTLSLSLANGKSFKSNANSIVEATKNVNKQKGLFLNTKDILKEISNVSAAVTLSLGKNPSAIGKTVATAKALGIELSKLESIAESLLNFESSIEAELSAELLIGRNINLEQARLLALNNDIAGMAEEISRQFGTAADFTNMNRIQQEAIAKAVGMSRDDLAQTLITQEQLRGLSKDEQARREKIIQQRISEVGLAQTQRELAQEGGIEQMEQQQSIAESFADNISLLKEMATNLLTALNPVLSIIQEILSHTTLIKGVFGAIAGIYVGKMAIGLSGMIANLVKMLPLSIANAAAATATAEAMTLGAATIPILAGIGAVVGLISSMKDGVIDPKKGPILSGEFGSVQLNPRDKAMYGADGNIKVGTNLAGNNTSSTQDNSALIAEIRAMRNELNNRPVVVHSVVKTENNDVLARGVNTSNRRDFNIQ
jgi:hypothetical protein